MKNGKNQNNRQFNMPKLDFIKLNQNKEDNIIQIFPNTARTPQSSGLDYAFKFHKAKIQTKDKNKMEEYIYDLENTWSINAEMFQNMLCDFSPFNNEQKRNVNVMINKIKNLFEKKKNLRTDKQKIRGKVLMDKQILEEFRRRNEENHAYYQEQVEEFRENLDKKDSFMKQFEKKFNEVEIYVQREAKSNPEKWESFITFEILAFINNNEMLQRRIMKINDKLSSLKEELNELLKENVELKKRDEFIDMSEDFDEKISKYNSLKKLYKSKIKFLERNCEHLKNVYKNISNKIENITQFNNDLEERLKCGNLGPNFYGQINSDKAIKSNNDKNNINFIESENINPINEYNESNEDVIDKNSSDDDSINNKSRIEIFKKDNSIDDHSMILKTPDFNFNKENWDISCIDFSEI